MKYIYLQSLRFVLFIHTYTYKLAAIFSIKYFGIHPKHEIINYAQWFSDNIETNKVVVDIGCKTGEMVALLSNNSKFVYGIEIESSSLSIAKARCSKANVEFILADATKFDYKKLKNKINYITLSNVLEHIEDRQRFLKNIIQGLGEVKPYILIRVPAYDREWTVEVKKKLNIKWKLDNTHYTEYTENQLLDELLTVGYKPHRVKCVFGEYYAVFVPNEK